MSDAFQRLYNATPFDPNDRIDQLGEIGRQVVIKAALGASRNIGELADAQDVMGVVAGMLVGLVQFAQSSLERGDPADRAIREMLVMNAAWAVDLARSSEGLDPLPTA